MQGTIYREHPLEHLEEALNLHICAIVEPWVGLGTAAKPTLDRASCCQSKCLSNQGTIVRSRLLGEVISMLPSKGAMSI